MYKDVCIYIYISNPAQRNRGLVKLFIFGSPYVGGDTKKRMTKLMSGTTIFEETRCGTSFHDHFKYGGYDQTGLNHQSESQGVDLTNRN